MKKKTKRLFQKIGVGLVIVGGLIHLFQPLGWNILSYFGNFSDWVQGIVGAITIWISVIGWKMVR